LATKWIKLSFTYDQSQNKVCNQDISEGDANATYDEVINSSVIDSTITPPINLQTRGYDAYCWSHVQSVDPSNGPLPVGAPSKRAFIRQVNDALGYEMQRFAVVEQSNDNEQNMLQSSIFYVDENDILQLTLQFRTRAHVPTGGDAIAFAVGYLLLYADDGTFWSYRNQAIVGFPVGWYQTDANFHLAGHEPFIGVDPTQTSEEWSQAAVNDNVTSLSNVVKIPKNGRCQILLGHFFSTDFSGSPQELWYKGISVTILPYLQGGYLQLKGDYNYSSNNSDIKQTLSEDIEISDSPKRYFKGALLRSDGLSLATPTWK
jgi:hypothetical protein